MKMNRKIIAFIILLASVGWTMAAFRKPGRSSERVREVTASIGSIETSVSVTGVVQPQTRLEIKPPIAGRVESVLVKEGQKVKAGEILATMSSTERAALLDAALSKKGETDSQSWEDVYKPIPLVAPIDGEVIVQTVRPGQSVTASDAVVVLSDRLIVQAQVDETDIGKVRVGQAAVITLDAYPDQSVDAAVDHVYFESKTVNNVTIYPVDILPKELPAFFRSGMSANVRMIGDRRDSALLLPLEAVKRDADGSTVMRVNDQQKPRLTRQKIETGLSDDTNVEILSGLNEGDRVAIVNRTFNAGKNNRPTNPLVPSFGGQRRNRSS